MDPLMISTPRLTLTLKTPAEVLAWVDSLPPEVRGEVSPDWVARVRMTLPGDVWALTFTVADGTSGAEVGACGFKGPPDADGMVEVAYGIDADHQRKGYASEATGALVAFASARGVRVVRAHTKPDNVASQRVLEKCGFHPLGMVVDPEDGEVLRFERAGADGSAI